MLDSIAARLRDVRRRIEAAELRAGRSPGSTKLLAVSKTMPAERVVEAVRAGQRLFGENRLQEAHGKIAQVNVILGDMAQAIRWDFIGHVQSNKVRSILEDFTLVHGIDSLKLVDRFDRVAADLGITAQGLLQVNVTGKETQFGLAPECVEEAAVHASGREHLRIRGLMTIGPLTDDEHSLRTAFATVRNLADSIRQRNLDGVEMEVLSMGMTGDFEIAVEEGSTLVRLGTAIFGTRNR